MSKGSTSFTLGCEMTEVILSKVNIEKNRNDDVFTVELDKYHK